MESLFHQLVMESLFHQLDGAWEADLEPVDECEFVYEKQIPANEYELVRKYLPPHGAVIDSLTCQLTFFQCTVDGADAIDNIIILAVLGDI